MLPDFFYICRDNAHVTARKFNFLSQYDHQTTLRPD